MKLINICHLYHHLNHLHSENDRILIFTHTDWSITRATLLHFIFSYIGLLPIGILAGWFSIKISNILIFTFYFIIIYLMIWIKSYFTNKKYVTEINRQLNKREK
ncbi:MULTISPECIES: DUF3021 domain-containing protein [unclassified Staphylococcus]|uniref:DUF3021 domain-containing protein n=1 Tax=unclassified Staphylococcus TaxID=91994 RepID=UPI000946ADF6|nr:DUF3021 domain-containing protein [Staphylococcus sp. GDY8P57P]MBF2757430.1 DUF3021 domain-containing protein [Staphylococcus haemolyticus]OLF33531.1 hypothetical protein BSZ10_00495 [Staphylococcus aureus]MBF2774106.1 DUF3021 domain-containing protein [Staphylococcus haemolyticus]MBF2776072.1 DUF3021 domain-containing protein [Staphylococcus haemolyticus]MBF2815731.1 DUF3021 domain-containing protein [Staphylococcus haemolyticus]